MVSASNMSSSELELVVVSTRLVFGSVASVDHSIGRYNKGAREAFCDFQYNRYHTRHFDNFLIFIPKMG